MSTAEITAYLAGIEIGRTSASLKVDPNRVPLGMEVDPENQVYRAWQRLGTEKFREWVLRGVGDAFMQ